MNTLKDYTKFGNPAYSFTDADGNQLNVSGDTEVIQFNMCNRSGWLVGCQTEDGCFWCLTDDTMDEDMFSEISIELFDALVKDAEEKK